MSRAPTGDGGAPLATYRLQLSPQFTLADARALVPYLDPLGVSHVYASPLLASRSGSTHGYDVVAHGAIDRALGTEDDLVAFGHVLADRGMGLIVDLVPNHMCIADEENQRWRDVLENGQGSVWVDFFDIDWGPPKPALAGKVLLPIPGDQFGRELESGALAVELHDGAFRLRHGDHVLPLAPPSWRLILEPLWRRVSTRAGGEAEAAVEVESILRALGHWPTERVAARARRHERDAIVRRLAALASADGAVADDLTAVLREIKRHEERATQLRRARDPRRGAALPPRALARGRRRDQLPALLRHQRPRGHTGRARGRLPRGPRAPGALGRAWPRERLPRRSRRRPARASALPRAPAGARGPWSDPRGHDPRREDPRRRRDAAR